MKMIMKLWIILPLLLIGLFLSTPNSVYALSSVLGASVVVGEGITIGGVTIEDPTEEFPVDTQTPTFSGYTVPNVRVTLIFRSEPIYRETLSDATGYWTYTLDTPIEEGSHTISMNITDSNGNTGEEVLVASFRVPEVKGESTSTLPAISPEKLGPNYLTVSLAVLGGVILLGLIYAVLSKRSQST